MDIQEVSRQQEPSDDEKVNPNLVITITMKKTENQTSSGAGSSAWEPVSKPTLSGDSNNNDGAKSAVKKESSAKEFCKNLFNKSSGDKNNNQTPPVVNQYTKVTADGFMSQLTLHENRQLAAQQGNSSAVSQVDLNMRWASDLLKVKHNFDNDKQILRSELTSHHLCVPPCDYDPLMCSGNIRNFRVNIFVSFSSPSLYARRLVRKYFSAESRTSQASNYCVASNEFVSSFDCRQFRVKKVFWRYWKIFELVQCKSYFLLFLWQHFGEVDIAWQIVKA